MKTAQANFWTKVSPWLIILSALPTFILIIIFFQFLIEGFFASGIIESIPDIKTVNEKFPVAWKVFSYTLQLVIIYILVRIYWVRILKYKFYEIGFEHPVSTAKELLLGLLTGLFLIGTIFLILLLTKQIEITSIQFSTKYFLLNFYIYLLVSYYEELLFRGYLLGATMKLANKYLVLFVFALLFSFAHAFNDNFQLLAAVNIFLAGIILGIYFIHTKRLWFSISLHFIWNFLQGPVLGSQVSGGKIENSVFAYTTLGKDSITGGDFGFEGSILMTVLLIILIIAVELFARKKAKA